MSSLPHSTNKKLGLVIDLDTCVGCHACVINCKEWNTSGYGTALSDQDPYGANPTGAWLNRIHEVEAELGRQEHFFAGTQVVSALTWERAAEAMTSLLTRI